MTDTDKAMRLREVWRENEDPTAGWFCVLSEARAIVREEQAATAVVTLHDAREFELEQVRADITRTAERMLALSQTLLYKYGPGQSVRPAFPPYDDELDRLVHAYCTQSARERELTAKSEPEGGDHG